MSLDRFEDFNSEEKEDSKLSITEEEIKIFEEIKVFLKEFKEGDYSTGDAVDTLEYFSEKLGI